MNLGFGNKKKPPASPSSKCFKQAVLCGAVSLFCLINIRMMWFFFLFFTGMTVFNGYYFVKYSKREEEAVKKQKELYGETGEEDEYDESSDTDSTKARPSFLANHKANDMQRQEQYNRFLNDLENQLGDFDIDTVDEEQK